MSGLFAGGNTILIAGGASGIGYHTARLCSSKKMNVVIVDNNKQSLDEAQSKLKETGGGDIHAFQVDVSSLQAWQKLKQDLATHKIKPDMYFLNAGVGAKGDWSDNDYFHKIFSTNFFGVVNAINTFVDDFKDSSTGKDKAVIITGSKQGITNPPGNPAYNASKAALKSLAESLSYDLAKSAPNTSVHLLVPGWTYTGLTGGAGAAHGVADKPAGAWSGEQVAEFLVDHVAQGKFYIICPDNDVSWDMDRRRIRWTAEDLVYGRPPLTRWREEYKEEAERTMKGYEFA